jgi:ribosomal protein S11
VEALKPSCGLLMYFNRRDTHIFDGTIWKGAGTIQICDITDPEVLWLTQGTRGVRKTCDVSYESLKHLLYV